MQIYIYFVFILFLAWYNPGIINNLKLEIEMFFFIV